MKKIGFALEGGAMKGLYTAGLLDALYEKNFKIDEMIGVSAGALFGINYKSHQLGRAIRYNLKYCKNKNYMGYYSLLTTGDVMNKDFCFNKLVYELDPFDFKSFKEDPLKFYCVVTNVDTCKAEYIELTDLADIDQLEYLRASGSMPYVSKIVNIKNNGYLDGALADSVPVEEMLKHDVDKVVVVLTKTKGYRKHKHNPFITNMFYRKNKNLANLINNRYKMYNEQMELIDKLEKEGKIFVIRPSIDIDIKRIEKDRKKLQLIYDLGRKDLLDIYDKLIEFIGE